MDHPLQGQVALVVGASRGIGAATAHALAEAGAHVVLAARDQAALQVVADRITEPAGRAPVVPTDVRNPDSVSGVVERTLDAHGRLDIAVNCVAGGGRVPTPLADLPIADFDAAIAVDLRGIFLAMKYEIPAMLPGGGGAIVNLSSTAALRPVAGLAGYVAAKAALIGLTRTAALDYAAHGIRVNAIAPGPTLTEHLDRAGPAARARAAASVPAGRLGRVEEIASAAVWLCGPGAAFVTGETLTVDGGLLAGMAPYGRPLEPTQE